MMKTVETHFFLIFLRVVFLLGSTFFACFLSAQESKDKTDIVQIGMNMYREAYDWEIKEIPDFRTQAYEKFAKKVNSLIEDHPSLKAKLDASCVGNCKPYILDSLDDDERLKEYLENRPKNSGPEIGIIMQHHANKNLKKLKQEVILNDLYKEVETKIVPLIRVQVQEQTNYFRDVAKMGLYLDGDVENSPYDLLDDVRNLDKIFFRELPKLGDYNNTSKKDQPNLIKNQEGKPEKKSEEKEKTQDEAMPHEKICDEGYCMRIKTVQNWDSNFFTKEFDQETENEEEKNKNSFQEIFENGTQWLIKEADNLNLACRVSPTIQFMENRFSLTFQMYKAFSGTSVFPMWTPPPILVNYLRRRVIDEFDEEDKNPDNRPQKLPKERKEILKQEKEIAERRMLLSLEKSFRRMGMDFYRPTNINATLYNAIMLEKARMQRTNVPSDITNSINIAEMVFHSSGLATGSVIRERPYVKRYNIDSFHHLPVVFDDIASRARMMYEFVHPLETIVDYINSKDDCPGS